MTKPPALKSRKDRPAGPLWIYGRHAVAAVMRNPARHVHRLVATRNAAQWLTDEGLLQPDGWQPEDTKPDQIDRLLPAGAVHQGLAIEVNDLSPPPLADIATEAAKTNTPILVLDQITDPQNIGALFRSAAAFGAAAVVMQDRRTPPLSGALAKAAAGALESVAALRVVNIARALGQLQEAGYLCAGLAGEADMAIADLPRTAPIALVLGAEGAGLRQLVGETCDELVHIPITPEMESLNVSNAGAIALYELTRQKAPLAG